MFILDIPAGFISAWFWSSFWGCVLNADCSGPWQGGSPLWDDSGDSLPSLLSTGISELQFPVLQCTCWLTLCNPWPGFCPCTRLTRFFSLGRELRLNMGKLVHPGPDDCWKHRPFLLLVFLFAPPLWAAPAVSCL